MPQKSKKLLIRLNRNEMFAYVFNRPETDDRDRIIKAYTQLHTWCAQNNPEHLSNN